MRKWKLAAAATAASGALAIGMFAAFSLTAKAGTISETAWGCSSSFTGTVAETSALTCTATDTAATGKEIPFPLSITLEATTSTSASPNSAAGLPVAYSWSSDCTEQSQAQVKETGTATPAVANDESTLVLVPKSASTSTNLGVIDPTTCDLTITVTVTGTSALTATGLNLTVLDDESAAANSTATPTPTPTVTKSTPPPAKTYTNQVHGFDGMCMDDHLNSAAVRAQIVVWQCNNKNPAQAWTFSGSELKIHGLCLNAKGNGKQNSKLILWTCNSSPNEIFSHRADGEFVEKANGWSLCLNDPGYSTQNGTQMIVYKCKNTANEHFTKP